MFGLQVREDQISEKVNLFMISLNLSLLNVFRVNSGPQESRSLVAVYVRIKGLASMFK